ncbi:TonB-dependent receptor [Aureisphaera galaxeae]|uniref:TonB-dependent receptor domain-containing protein n=1 Tax=Aureisphaera galaxeae TaxID=1538023 RepID=UPI00234FFFE8|nr:TonB-dependent receptor [Aureisphaera galaxeae]MDC8004717.1 TonB-dependent receptor [Aureisphaera galaxeae]
MKRIFLFILLAFPNLVLSQVEIRGEITDVVGPIAFANVYLSDAGNNLVQGAISDENGKFVIEATPGSYVLTIGYLGYKDWKKEIELSEPLNLGVVQLSEDSELLGEVVVTAKKKVFERKVDRLVFNVENSLAATGGDAMDALKVSPGVFIKNNEITMIGKSGMRLMINGRISPLTGQDMVNFLQTISADDIKSIEVITNPPAKYDAAGNSGLINIVFKKGIANSWNNAISYSYLQSTYAAHSLRNNYSLKEDKYQMLLSVNGGLGDELNQLRSETFFAEGPWVAFTDRKHSRDFLSTKFNFDYDISDKTTVGVQYLFNYNLPDYTDRTNTLILDTNRVLDSLRSNNGINEREVVYHNLNGHIIHKIDTMGREISVDVDYLNYGSDTDRTFQTNSFDANNVFVNTIAQANNFANQDITNFSARVDVEHPFSKIRFSYGGKLSFIENDSKTEFFNTITGEPVLDPNQTDDFRYKESIQALYVSASKNLTEKWRLKLGLRFERIMTETFTATLNQTNEIDYDEFFPTAYLQYTLNDNHAFYASYGRRIDRPSYSALNPFRFFYDSNKFSEGNPFLRPSFTNNFELGWGGEYINANVFYSKQVDGSGPVTFSFEESNLTIIRQENYFEKDSYGVVVSGGKEITSWWENYNTLYFVNYEPSLTNNDIDAVLRGTALFLGATNNRFNLNKEKTFTSNLGFQYVSPFSDDLFDYGSSYNLSVSFRYRMLDKKLNFTVAFNDIFNTDPSDLEWVTNGIRQNYYQNNSSRNVKFTLSYNFGNKTKRVRARDSGNEDERDRL